MSKFPEKLCSPSRVDSYIQFLTGYVYNFGNNFQEYTQEFFIDRLLGIEDPASKLNADAGSACHELIEKSRFTTLKGSYQITGWTVIIDENLQVDLEYPQCREQWVDLEINGLKILGKVDAIDAVSIHDLKFTSQIDIEKYIDSYQWKMYLMGTGLSRMVYDLFTVKVDKSAKTVTIKDYNKLVLNCYPGMEEEVTEVITEYLDLLIRMKPLFIERINQYNNQINKLIADLEWSPVVTAKPEIQQLIEVLKTKYIKMEGI